MSVGVLIVTHPHIGRDVLAAARHILKTLPLEVAVVEIGPDAPPERLLEQIRERLAALDQGEGVLLLTDLFGATPSNLAVEAARGGPHRIVSGLSLPMLLRVLNYPDLSLDALAAKAASAADTIVDLPAPERP
ncbi:MAG: hypothetical protein KatS3mg121_0568 [Gammaproteobacteria bacterium]|nr:MAG: hypothetical protein KatS3mg121_0568 [Gammaproteobacteria bacterium]